MVVFLIALVHLTCWAEATQESEYWTGDIGHGFDDFPWSSMRHPRQSQIDHEYDHQLESVSGCLYNGARWSDGEEVSTRATCLRCRCSGGALVCRLRVCPALPDPPPARCVLVLRRDACCAQLHCPDGGGYNSNHIGRLESEGGDLVEATPFGDGCIYHGTVYAAGSAMSSSSACEHCFCIGGRQRCVRPTCLPPPPGCRPRRAHRDQSLQACCPDYYHCEEPTTTPRAAHDTHIERGCRVDGLWFPEGEKVESETVPACDNCFCLKGIVRCLPMACAPPILGCAPVIRPGECCAHSYDCNGAAALNERVHDILMGVTDNFITSVKNEDRSFHGGHIDTKIETTSPLQYREDSGDITDDLEDEEGVPLTDLSTESTTQIVSSTSSEEDYTESEETSDSDEEDEDEVTSTTNSVTLTLNSSKVSEETETASTMKYIDTTGPSVTTSTNSSYHESKDIANDNFNFLDSETDVKIGINGTINCTAEISSSQISKEEEISQKINKSYDDQYNDTEARNPSIDRTDEMDIDDYTYTPNELIISNELDTTRNKTNSTSLMIPKDNDVFMVNVSTFVRTNLSTVTLPPVAKLPPEIEALLNSTTKNKDDDYNEYDYSEPTLPPSLPNLKIIPFVAADAVLDEEVEPKKNMKYPNIYPLEREDKFPTIFSSNAKPDNSTVFSLGKDTMYHETSFPAYDKDNYVNSPTQFPVIHHDLDLSAEIFNSDHNDVRIHSQPSNIFDDYAGTAFTSLHNYHPPTIYTVPVTELVTENPLLHVGTHDVNLFSPPIETEGGFLPKEPLLTDEYYDVRYPSRPASSHTTIPIQTAPVDFDTLKGCVTDSKQYDQGEILKKPDECMTCICFYGNFHCREQDCPYAKEGCTRLDTEEDKCCGRIVCDDEEKTTPSPITVNTTLPDIELVTIAHRIDTPDPFVNVIRTEPAPSLQSLIGNINPLFKTESTTNLNNNPIVMNVSDSNVTNQVENHGINILDMFNTSAVNVPSQIPSTVADSNSHFKTTTAKYQFTVDYGYSSTSPAAQNSTDDYEEDEQDDEGFSFGNVLKLLLSDSYDTKAALSKKNKTKVQSSTAAPINFATIPPFKPFSNNYIPIKSIYPSLKQTDNAVTKYTLSEPAWISQYVNEETQPSETTVNVVSTTIRYPTTTSNRPLIRKEQEIKAPTSESSQQALTTSDRKPYEVHKPPNLQHVTQAPFAAGILKLAGCNIYGRMYRVGRIISELSTPCLQCMCTEAGVQCKQLSC